MAKSNGRTIKIIHIGAEFYLSTSTVMSSVYKVVDGGYERYDFGFLQRDLALGYNITIRQATKKEMTIFNAQLGKVRRP